MEKMGFVWVGFSSYLKKHLIPILMAFLFRVLGDRYFICEQLFAPLTDHPILTITKNSSLSPTKCTYVVGIGSIQPCYGDTLAPTEQAQYLDRPVRENSLWVGQGRFRMSKEAE